MLGVSYFLSFFNADDLRDGPRLPAADLRVGPCAARVLTSAQLRSKLVHRVRRIARRGNPVSPPWIRVSLAFEVVPLFALFSSRSGSRSCSSAAGMRLTAASPPSDLPEDRAPRPPGRDGAARCSSRSRGERLRPPADPSKGSPGCTRIGLRAFHRRLVLTTNASRTRADFRQVVVDYAEEAASRGAVPSRPSSPPAERISRGVSWDDIFSGYCDGAEEAASCTVRDRPDSRHLPRPLPGRCRRVRPLLGEVPRAGGRRRRARRAKRNSRPSRMRRRSSWRAPKASPRFPTRARWPAPRRSAVRSTRSGLTASATESRPSKIQRSSRSSAIAESCWTCARSRTFGRAPSPRSTAIRSGELAAAGIRCSISTDDPAMFDTDLERSTTSPRSSASVHELRTKTASPGRSATTCRSRVASSQSAPATPASYALADRRRATRRRLVLPLEVGVEHRRVVGGDRAADAGGRELAQRMLVQRRDGAGPDVRDRADVQHDPALAELLDERRILDRADAVADPVGAERVERAADRRGARTSPACGTEPRPSACASSNAGGVRLGRVVGLSPPSPTPTTPRSRYFAA